MMSKNNLYVAMACAILAFTGCTEDDMPGGNTKPAHPGEEIIFGGTLDSKATRTVYGDKHVDDKYTEVKWVAGDGVRIYCAEALYQDAEFNDIMLPGSTEAAPLYQKYCEYTVTDGVTDLGSVIDGEKQDTHSTGLKPSGEGYGLRWGSNGTHKFYAVYPSKTQLTGKDEEAANALKLEGKTLTAQLPNMQGATDATHSTYTINDGNVTYYPAMRYAYMTAHKSSVPVSNLSLTFEPVVTAVEITLQNKTKIKENGTEKNQDLEVEMITLSHPTAALCGMFTADLETKVVTNANADASFKTVSVPTKMKSADGGTEKGNLMLAHGKTVTITAFMALNDNANLDQIKVSILANGQLKTATLSSTTDGVQIVQAKKKNFISTVNIGYTTEVAVDYSHWVTDLKTVAPNTTLGALSIPGAGGATSWSVSDNTSKEQTLGIAGLWAQGVRCFEFMVDNESYGNNWLGQFEDNFGAQKVSCNGVETSTTLNAAMDSVSSFIASSKEFGMVIITYQEKNLTSYDRNAGENGFADYFGTWWENYKYTGVTKKLFSSSLTVKDAEGCLFCIGRPVAAGLDAGWYTGVYDDTKPGNFSDGTVLNVLGWGNNADQWYARGFGKLYYASTNDTWSSTNPTSGVMDRPYYVGQTSLAAIKPATSYTHTGKSNFEYKVSNVAHQTYSQMTTKGWIQEWRRVVPSESTRTQYGITELPATTTNGGDGNAYYYYWEPSEDEKWDDVVEALNKALTNDGTYTICLNSLCGYFVDGSIPMSYQPRLTYQRMMFDPSDFAQFKRERVCMDDKYMRNQDDTDAFGAFTNNHSPTNHDQPTIDDLGPYHVAGGFRGNINAYADWVNNRFYNLLLQKQANGDLTGTSTGIVMMDRVSDNAEENEAGYYIPRIIISMNFSGVESTTLETKTSVLEGGDALLSRKNFSVTWDK